MHFKKIIISTLSLFAISVSANCQDSLKVETIQKYSQDSLKVESLNKYNQDSLKVETVQKDSSSVKQANVSYQNLVYVSAFASQTLNDYFYSNFYKAGKGIQIGIPLYSQPYYTVRFNLAYSSFRFQMNEYLKTDTLNAGETIKGTPLEIVTFLPDILIHPMPNYLVSPYLNLGVGVMVGSNQPTITKSLPEAKALKTEKAFGTRYLAQVGTGGIVHLLPYLNIMAGVSYNIEFLRSHQPEDIFYKFKSVDNSFKYLYYQVGIQLKLKKN